ncbi:hypothetical protein FRAHR75_60008 [Frankia sp. Hr75.2]|nr:hypothetical protein FRAHR75_60008 [Frankia sp. Hr75.2]SQD95230.1 hypothetical protein FMEAI12_3060009 [Parafrankia sp. Ea1.12]
MPTPRSGPCCRAAGGCPAPGCPAATADGRQLSLATGGSRLGGGHYEARPDVGRARELVRSVPV